MEVWELEKDANYRFIYLKYSYIVCDTVIIVCVKKYEILTNNNNKDQDEPKSGNIWEEFYLDCLCEENLTLVKKVARRGQQVGKIAWSEFPSGGNQMGQKCEHSIQAIPKSGKNIDFFKTPNLTFYIAFVSFC